MQGAPRKAKRKAEAATTTSAAVASSSSVPAPIAANKPKPTVKYEPIAPAAMASNTMKRAALLLDTFSDKQVGGATPKSPYASGVTSRLADLSLSTTSAAYDVAIQLSMGINSTEVLDIHASYKLPSQASPQNPTDKPGGPPRAIHSYSQVASLVLKSAERANNAVRDATALIFQAEMATIVELLNIPKAAWRDLLLNDKHLLLEKLVGIRVELIPQKESFWKWLIGSSSSSPSRKVAAPFVDVKSSPGQAIIPQHEFNAALIPSAITNQFMLDGLTSSNVLVKWQSSLTPPQVIAAEKRANRFSLIKESVRSATSSFLQASIQNATSLLGSLPFQSSASSGGGVSGIAIAAAVAWAGVVGITALNFVESRKLVSELQILPPVFPISRSMSDHSSMVQIVVDDADAMLYLAVRVSQDLLIFMQRLTETGVARSETILLFRSALLLTAACLVSMNDIVFRKAFSATLTRQGLESFVRLIDGQTLFNINSIAAVQTLSNEVNQVILAGREYIMDFVSFARKAVETIYTDVPWGDIPSASVPAARLDKR